MLIAKNYNFLFQQRYFLVRNFRNDRYLCSIFVESKRFKIRIRKKLKRIKLEKKINKK